MCTKRICPTLLSSCAKCTLPNWQCNEAAELLISPSDTMQQCKGCCFTPSTNPASTCELWGGGIFIHQFLCASYLWGVMSSVPGHQTLSVTYCCNKSTISNVSCWTEHTSRILMCVCECYRGRTWVHHLMPAAPTDSN